MELYLTQLLSDLHTATLARWRQSPPHFYKAGLRDAMHEPPDGYIDDPSKNTMPDDIYASINEIEKWQQEKPAISMYDLFGFSAYQFPPAEQLTEEQARAMVKALVRLWVAYNFLPTVPTRTPARVFYPVMLAHMAKPAKVLEHGVNGIEFCHFSPENCPFGSEYCDCKDF